MNDGNILEVRDLKTHFFTEEGVVKAVDGISFDLKRGETLGIVGESGAGKSVTTLSILHLVPFPPGPFVGGEVLFDNKDLLKISENEIRKIRDLRTSLIRQGLM